MYLFKIMVVVCLLLVTPSMLYAADEAEDVEGETKEVPQAMPSTYIDLKPPFVANFGGPGRLRYVKTEVTLRVQPDGVRAIMHHMPAIRHNLIMLLSRQSVDGVSTMEGKELLRQDALEAVRDMLSHEEGEHYIADLLFGSFIVQNH